MTNNWLWFLVYLYLPSCAWSWGNEGHRITGYIALHYLSPTALDMVETLLLDPTDPSFNQLETATLWADRIKSKRPETEPLHYVSTKSDQDLKSNSFNPKIWIKKKFKSLTSSSTVPSCSYIDGRDCKDGKCVVGAISHYADVILNKCQPRTDSTRPLTLISDAARLFPLSLPPRTDSLSAFSLVHQHLHPHQYSLISQQERNKHQVEIRDALRFLLHFMGDVTQPLHVCGRENGGSSTRANFGGKSVKLHAVWDTHFVRKRIHDSFQGDLYAYAQDLMHHIQNGNYTLKSKEWIQELEPTETTKNPVSQPSTLHHKSSYASIASQSIPKPPYNARNKRGSWKAVVRWATETKGADCSIVWPDFDKNPYQDLSSSYYYKVIPTIDEQLAKGGLRMAKLLNRMAQDIKWKVKRGSKRKLSHPDDANIYTLVSPCEELFRGKEVESTPVTQDTPAVPSKVISLPSSAKYVIPSKRVDSHVPIRKVNPSSIPKRTDSTVPHPRTAPINIPQSSSSRSRSSPSFPPGLFIPPHLKQKYEEKWQQSQQADGGKRAKTLNRKKGSSALRIRPQKQEDVRWKNSFDLLADEMVDIESDTESDTMEMPVDEALLSSSPEDIFVMAQDQVEYSNNHKQNDIQSEPDLDSFITASTSIPKDSAPIMNHRDSAISLSYDNKKNTAKKRKSKHRLKGKGKRLNQPVEIQVIQEEPEMEMQDDHNDVSALEMASWYQSQGGFSSI